MANVSTRRGRGSVMREPTDILPDEITRFLHADSATGREDSWSSFLGRHNRLLLKVAYSVASNRDDAMDAYAAVLEQLREDNGRRLRTYAADGRSKFTTWLVIVARRICVDFVRQKYGRYASNGHPNQRRAARRSLVELLGSSADLTSLPDENAAPPDASLRSADLQAKLLVAVASLSDDDRLLLKLRFEDDLSASAIAKLVGYATPFHVYRRLNVVLSELRRRLNSHGVESADP
jgi:RNA polymerase sigma factor (sigma-70 family)